MDHSIIFSLIFEKFKAGLTDDERTEFQFTTLDDLRIELKKIQNKHTSERKQMWMNRLSRFLEAMGEYDKVIQVFVNPSQYLAFIWVSINLSQPTTTAPEKTGLNHKSSGES
jgi:hypothetical protein